VTLENAGHKMQDWKKRECPLWKCSYYSQTTAFFECSSAQNLQLLMDFVQL